MNNYELVFFVDPINEATEDKLIDELEAMPEIRNGQHLVTLNGIGNDGLIAARAAADQLRRLGVRPRRLDLDLVTQAIIAERCGVSRAAVTSWVKQGINGHLFPKPHTWLNGPVWVWDDVNDWLRCARAGAPYDSYRSPNSRDVARANLWLESALTPAHPVTVTGSPVTTADRYTYKDGMNSAHA